MKKLFLTFALAVGVSAFGCGSSPKKATTPKATEVKTTEPVDPPEGDPTTDPTTDPGDGDTTGGGTEEPANP